MSKKNIYISTCLLILGTVESLFAACCPISPTPASTIAAQANSVAFSPTGCLTLGASSGAVTTYPPVTPCVYTTPSSTVSIGAVPVTTVAFSPEGCLVATGDSHATIYGPTGSCENCDYTTVSTTIPTAAQINTAAFSASPNNCLALGTAAGTVTIYSPAAPDSCSYSTTPATTITLGASVTSVTFSPTNNCLAVGTSTDTVTLYAQIANCTYNTAPSQTITLTGSINSVAFSSAGCLAIADNSGLVTIYAPGAGCTYTLTTTITAAAIPTSIAFAPGTNCLVVGDIAGNLNSYNNTTDCTYSTSPVTILVGTGSPITSVAFSADGCLAAAFDTTVDIFPPDPALTVTIAPIFSSVCAGSTITLTATAIGGSGTYTYAWTGPNGFVATGNPITIPNASQANAGQYTVTVTDSTGCTASSNAFVDIEVIGAPLSASPESICIGQSSTLTVNIADGIPPFTVTFSGFPSVVTSSTIVTQVVAPTTTTSYTVTVSDSAVPACSVTSNTVTVTVNPLPTPIITSVTANCNGTITITGTANPGDTIEIFNGATQIAIPITVPASGIFSITTVALPAGTYTTLTLTAVSSVGCSATIPVPSITVNPTLGVTIVGSAIACEGTTLTLTADASGGSGTFTNYAWTGPNGFSQTGPSNTISIPNVTLANAGGYTVTVTDSVGCTASATFFVQVVSVGTALTVSPSTICFGVGTSTLTAFISTGLPPYTAVFSDGHVITNITTSSVTYNVSPAVTTNYTVTITDSNGCSATSNVVTVTVSRTTIPVIVSAIANCNRTVTITGTADPGDTIAVFNGVTQVAGPILVPASGTFSVTTSVLAPATVNLTVVATNPFGCTASAQTGPIVINPTLAVTIVPPTQTVCAGSTITLTANPTGGTGTYVNYAWTGPNGFTQTGPSNTVTIPGASTVNNGIYRVTVTDSAGCTASASATVVVPSALLTGTSTICAGKTATLTVSIFDINPPYTVQFSDGHTVTNVTGNTVIYTPTPLTTTTYTATVIDSAVPPCTFVTNPVTVTVSVVTSPVIASVTINCDNTVTIIGTADPGDTIGIFMGSDEFAVPIVVPPSGLFTITTAALAPGVYNFTVVATNSLCCTASAVVTPLTIVPLLNVTITGPTIVCQGATLTLTAETTGGTTPYTFAWTGPNGFTSTTQTITISDVTQANAGLYTVTVVDAHGCSVSASLCVEVDSLGVVLSASPELLCSGSSILTATLFGGNPPYTVTFSGFPPIVTNSTVVTQAVTPASTTTYTVTVSDSGGCSVTSPPVTVTVALITAPIITSALSNCLGQMVINGITDPGDKVSAFLSGLPIAIPVIAGPDGSFTLITTPLIAGIYTFTITASNAAGCSASTNITVTVACTPTITLLESACTVSRTGRPIITGITTPFTAVTIFIDATQEVMTFSDSTGNFYFIPEFPLADGTYTFVATTLKADGTIAISNTITIIVNATEQSNTSTIISNKYCPPCPSA